MVSIKELLGSKEIFKGLRSPTRAIIYLLAPLFPKMLRFDLDLYDYPWYAYCLLESAKLARRLNIFRTSAIEFGVAGGRGLIQLEKISHIVTDITKVKIDIYGFDLKTGLPRPKDYKDMPYNWKKGFFRMNVENLKRKIKNAKLILGDVKKTVPEFFKKFNPAPIGFVSFDLDLYSSTANKKICLINGLGHRRIIDAAWCYQAYMLHIFNHPLYNAYVYAQDDIQMPI